MSAYATPEDFEAYVEGWTTEDKEALERLLARASRDVDSLLGNWSIEAGGLKFGDLAADENPKEISDADVEGLSLATCAQAEYRNEMGEEFFVRGQHHEVAGPEFKTTGTLPYIGPKVARELKSVTVAASFRGARARP